MAVVGSYRICGENPLQDLTPQQAMQRVVADAPFFLAKKVRNAFTGRLMTLSESVSVSWNVCIPLEKNDCIFFNAWIRASPKQRVSENMVKRELDAGRLVWECLVQLGGDHTWQKTISHAEMMAHVAEFESKRYDPGAALLYLHKLMTT